MLGQVTNGTQEKPAFVEKFKGLQSPSPHCEKKRVILLLPMLAMVSNPLQHYENREQHGRYRWQYATHPS